MVFIILNSILSRLINISWIQFGEDVFDDTNFDYEWSIYIYIRACPELWPAHGVSCKSYKSLGFRQQSLFKKYKQACIALVLSVELTSNRLSVKFSSKCQFLYLFTLFVIIHNDKAIIPNRKTA